MQLSVDDISASHRTKIYRQPFTLPVLTFNTENAVSGGACPTTGGTDTAAFCICRIAVWFGKWV